MCGCLLLLEVGDCFRGIIHGLFCNIFQKMSWDYLALDSFGRALILIGGSDAFRVCYLLTGQAFNLE